MSLISNVIRVYSTFLLKFSLRRLVCLLAAGSDKSWRCKIQELIRILVGCEALERNLVRLWSLESGGMIQKAPRNREARGHRSGNRLHPKRFSRIMAGIKHV